MCMCMRACVSVYMYICTYLMERKKEKEIERERWKERGERESEIVKYTSITFANIFIGAHENKFLLNSISTL